MSLEITPTQAATALAVQVKRQIANTLNQKNQLGTTVKAQLTQLLARDDVKAALGTDLVAAQEAVASI